MEFAIRKADIPIPFGNENRVQIDLRLVPLPNLDISIEEAVRKPFAAPALAAVFNSFRTDSGFCYRHGSRALARRFN